MQRKPGFPLANCNIKMPESIPGVTESGLCEDDGEQQQKRQMLINFGHSQWGFNNWSWMVTKQELDFIDFSSGKYCAGVVAFVSVKVKSLDIQRENIGYATTVAQMKGSAIYQARKCAVTNALRETLLSFGGVVASELFELLETHRGDTAVHPEPTTIDTNHSSNKGESKNICANKVKNIRKDSVESNGSSVLPAVPVVHPKNIAQPPANLPSTNLPSTNLPPANLPPRPLAPPPPSATAPPLRPNSNVSFVLQPVMPPPMYGPPARVAPPLYPNAYYECGPWHFSYESYDRHHQHGNVNLNFNMPPKNLVVNGRPPLLECRNACAREEPPYCPPPQGQGCWIKPTIFYDGFWTEQKVKKWVAEQVQKQFPDEGSKPAEHPQEVNVNAVSEDEARAERKRRQRLAQEEFRTKQMMRKPS